MKHNYLYQSVCPFIRQLPKVWTQYSENELTDFDAKFHRCSAKKGYEMINFVEKKVKDQGHEAKYIFGGLAEASFLMPMGRIVILAYGSDLLLFNTVLYVSFQMLKLHVSIYSE